mgnify:FL=1
MGMPPLGFHAQLSNGCIDWNLSESLLIPGTLLVMLLLLLLLCGDYIKYECCVAETDSEYDILETYIEA